jgi:hypothetical protein
MGRIDVKKAISALLMSAVLPACSSLPLFEPRTIGEINANYDYIPLEPSSVMVLIDGLPADAGGAARDAWRYRLCVPRREGPGKSSDVMDALPDNTVRMAVEHITASGSVAAPVVTASANGNQYRVIADSVITDEIAVPFAVRLIDAAGNAIPILSRRGHIHDGDRFEVLRLESRSAEAPPGFERFAIPIYIGVGLRLTADIATRNAKVNISSLPALAAGVEAQRIRGNLTLQAMGIFRQQIVTLLQAPTELNAASIQQALVAFGAARAIVYDHDTGTRPRVLGIANPFQTNDPRLVQQIRSELVRLPVNWVPCGAA